MFCCALLYVHSSFDGEERAGCFAWFVFLVSRDCCVALPRGVMGLSAVCDCGISRSYSLTIFGCVPFSDAKCINEFLFVCLFVLLLYVQSQQLWSWRDGQFT